MSIFTSPKLAMQRSGGEGIRTPDRDSPMPVFKTGAFNRSATPPVEVPSYRLQRLNECLLLQQANHRGDGFLHQPPVFVVKRPIGETFDDIRGLLDGVFDVGGI